MSRGLDAAALKKVVSTLRKHKAGLWVRELSRLSGVSKSSVSRYLARDLAGRIEIYFIGNAKIARLKSRASAMPKHGTRLPTGVTVARLKK